MKVRAKFRCQSITDYGQGMDKRVEFQAVYGREGENADYSKYTPSGRIEMNLSPDTKAAEAFAPGREFYVDFTPAEG